MNIPLNIDWQQILLHLFNFAILVGGLYFLLYNPVKKFIKKREEHYVEVDQEAEARRQEALQLAQEHKAKLEGVEQEIAQKKAEAQKEIDRMRDEQLAEAHKQAEAILNQAKASAEQEHRDMLERVSGELKDLVLDAAEKIILKDQKDPYQQFLDLAEREGSNGKEQ